MRPWLLDSGKEKTGGCDDSPNQTSYREATLAAPKDNRTEYKKRRKSENKANDDQGCATRETVENVMPR